jgi:hypothetical protein
MRTFISRDMFQSKAQMFIESLHENGVNAVKLSTGIQRTFSSWDMFHRKAQIFVE